MAKKPCPRCKTLFDYEFNSWVCPECGTVITGSMEGEVHDWYCEHDLPKPEYKSAPTVLDYDKKHGTGKYKNRKLISTVAVLVTVVVFILIAAVVIKTTENSSDVKDTFFPTNSHNDANPETESSIEAETEKEASGNTSDGEQELEEEIFALGEYISMDGYELVIHAVYAPDWNELPKVDGYRFVAVSYERLVDEGGSSYGFDGMEAWALLHDKTSGMYLSPLYESDVVDTSYPGGLPADYKVRYDLDVTEGTLLYLVKSDSTDFELAIYEGENDRALKSSMVAERRITIPIIRISEEVDSQ